MEIRRVCGGGGGEVKPVERDGVGAAAGAIEAVGAVAVAVAVAVMGASRSGSVIVVSWDVFIPETSKSELASGEIDLLAPPVVCCDADGSSCAAVSIVPGAWRVAVTEGHATM